MSLLASSIRLHLRPLPSTGVTRLPRYFEPLRHPIRPVLSLASCPLIPSYDHRWGFPCCTWSTLSACRRHYPGRPDGTDSLMTAPSSSAFPRLQLGRLLHYQFRGLLSVHSRYNLQTRQVAFMRPSTPEAPTALLPPPPLRLLPGGAIQFPGGFISRCGPVPFTAHCNRLVASVEVARYTPR